MRLDIHVHHHFPQAAGPSLSDLLRAIKEGTLHMSTALDNLRAEVQQSNDATQSALTLIAGLAQQIRDAVGNDDALNELADQLDAQQQEIAAAVAANTPAAPGEDTPPAGDDTPPAA